MKLKRDNAALARQFLYIAQTELSRANDTLATTRSQIKAIIGQLGSTGIDELSPLASELQQFVERIPTDVPGALTLESLIDETRRLLA